MQSSGLTLQELLLPSYWGQSSKCKTCCRPDSSYAERKPQSVVFRMQIGFVCLCAAWCIHPAGWCPRLIWCSASRAVCSAVYSPAPVSSSCGSEELHSLTSILESFSLHSNWIKTRVKIREFFSVHVWIFLNEHFSTFVVQQSTAWQCCHGSCPI